MINHQFLNQPWFLPNWKCKTLVIGSFNPECGEETDFFYGRLLNRFWRAMAHLQGLPHTHYLLPQNRLELKLGRLHQCEFGCADIIRKVEVNDNYINSICAEGYNDSRLFNMANVTRFYNTSYIIERLNQGDIKNVVIALGAREAPVEYLAEKQSLIAFCNENNITVHDDQMTFSPLGGRTVVEIAEYLAPFCG